ncbi:unnamed protein product [Acanthocheilonema viteae]|uniref:Uncharacterized protein n=1 Tax=Acanthocheilonema viteae TaxID=6277 RepID=A0A498SR64_ACAVI|nr:unnamed protein product [Acanthocheilonema viteae]
MALLIEHLEKRNVELQRINSEGTALMEQTLKRKYVNWFNAALLQLEHIEPGSQDVFGPSILEGLSQLRTLYYHQSA